MPINEARISNRKQSLPKEQKEQPEESIEGVVEKKNPEKKKKKSKHKKYDIISPILPPIIGINDAIQGSPVISRIESVAKVIQKEQNDSVKPKASVARVASNDYSDAFEDETEKTKVIQQDEYRDDDFQSPRENPESSLDEEFANEQPPSDKESSDVPQNSSDTNQDKLENNRIPSVSYDDSSLPTSSSDTALENDMAPENDMDSENDMAQKNEDPPPRGEEDLLTPRDDFASIDTNEDSQAPLEIPTTSAEEYNEDNAFSEDQ